MISITLTLTQKHNNFKFYSSYTVNAIPLHIYPYPVHISPKKCPYTTERARPKLKLPTIARWYICFSWNRKQQMGWRYLFNVFFKETKANKNDKQKINEINKFEEFMKNKNAVFIFNFYG